MVGDSEAISPDVMEGRCRIADRVSLRVRQTCMTEKQFDVQARLEICNKSYRRRLEHTFDVITSSTAHNRQHTVTVTAAVASSKCCGMPY